MIHSTDKKVISAKAAFFGDHIHHWEKTCAELPEMTPIEQIVFWHINSACIKSKFFYWTIQEQIGKYRVDFTFKSADGNKKLVVECDGHDFHEKTKEQASRDKERDRFLQSEGWVVFRFSGSDIWNNPNSVTGEILDFLGVRR